MKCEKCRKRDAVVCHECHDEGLGHMYAEASEPGVRTDHARQWKDWACTRCKKPIKYFCECGPVDVNAMTRMFDDTQVEEARRVARAYQETARRYRKALEDIAVLTHTDEFEDCGAPQVASTALGGK